MKFWNMNTYKCLKCLKNIHNSYQISNIIDYSSKKNCLLVAGPGESISIVNIANFCKIKSIEKAH